MTDEGPLELSPEATSISGLSVWNTMGRPASNRLLLHDIGSTQSSPCCNATLQSWRTLKTFDASRLTLKNTRGTTLKLSLKIRNPDLFRLPNGERSLTLRPGQSYSLAVKFSPNRMLTKGVYSSLLELASGTQRTAFALAGMFMQYPEGGREIYLKQLVNDAFGYKINLGANRSGGISSSSPRSARAGEEVRSAYWRVADPRQAVSATQIAAFHSCCKDRPNFQIIPKGRTQPVASMHHASSYGQTIYPRPDGTGNLTYLSTRFGSAFEIRIAGYSSNPQKGIGNGNLGVRFWPLRSSTGASVPNTYLIAMDYVQRGCGTTSKANCDYNDNVYLLKNVKPSY